MDNEKFDRRVIWEDAGRKEYSRWLNFNAFVDQLFSVSKNDICKRFKRILKHYPSIRTPHIQIVK